MSIAHRLLTIRMRKARQTRQQFREQHAPEQAAASSNASVADLDTLKQVPTASEFLDQQLATATITARLLPPQLTLYIGLAFVTMITIAEAVTAMIDPYGGLLIHSALVVLTAAMAAQWWGHPVSRMLTVFIFAPLIRLLSLSLPLVGFEMPIWWLTISVPLFIAIIIAVRTLNLSWYEIGHRLGRGPPLVALIIQMLVATVGLGFGYIEYYVLQPAPLVETLTWQHIWVPALILIICTGYLEELLFRGIMQHVAREMMGPWTSNLLVSLIFAALHIGYLSLYDYIFVFCASLFFGWVYEHTRSLIGITLAHGITNVMLFIVLPLVLDLPPGLELPL
jgi:hypothetical protein